MSTALTHIETEKQLVPALRFKEFERDIVQCLFENIFLFSTGKNIKQAEASPEFETPCVRYGELYHMYGEVIKEVINKTNLDTSELLFSKGDEILLPSAGEDPLDIGSASALTIENVAIGRTINILRPQEENVYSQIFASYFINEKLRKKISTLARGASISNVYNSDLKKLRINLPSIPEQQKIASFLSAVDEKIQQLTKKKALLEDYKKGVMQQLFSGQLRFKDENGNSYPDWEEKRLGEVTINNHQGINTVTEKVEYRRSGIPILQAKHITSGAVVIDDARFVSLQDFEAYKDKYALKLGDVLLTNIGTIGEIVHIKTDMDLLIAWNIFKMKPGKPLDPSFFSYQMMKISKSGYLNRMATGNATKFVNKKDILNIALDLPSLVEQQKIATYLSGIDTKIEAVNNQITQTQTYKKGLLQQMFV
jgi:type I restriction enzyme S subunit